MESQNAEPASKNISSTSKTILPRQGSPHGRSSVTDSLGFKIHTKIIRKRLSDKWKLRIIALHESGYNPTQIVSILSNEGLPGVSRTTVYKTCKKWNVSRTVDDVPSERKGPKNVTNEICDYIDCEMEKNNELTGSSLTKNLNQHFQVSFSVSKVRKLRRSLGWLATKTKYCQLVREVNREKRLKFASDCLKAKETFDDVIFTDECNIQLDWNGAITFHRWWEPCPLKGKPKHPFKVSVWAGISKFGATPILTFTGIMEKTFYCDSILRDTLLPFINTTFPYSHRFMQDNDPKHTSILGRETMAKNNINWWKTPPESPDMNPIENLWHEIKHYLRTIVKPRTKEDLLRGISEFWVRVTPEKCCKYIDHLQRVLPVVVERNGKASGF